MWTDRKTGFQTGDCAGEQIRVCQLGVKHNRDVGEGDVKLVCVLQLSCLKAVQLELHKERQDFFVHFVGKVGHCACKQKVEVGKTTSAQQTGRLRSSDGGKDASNYRLVERTNEHRSTKNQKGVCSQLVGRADQPFFEVEHEERKAVNGEKTEGVLFGFDLGDGQRVVDEAELRPERVFGFALNDAHSFQRKQSVVERTHLFRRRDHFFLRASLLPHVVGRVENQRDVQCASFGRRSVHETKRAQPLGVQVLFFFGPHVFGLEVQKLFQLFGHVGRRTETAG